MSTEYPLSPSGGCPHLYPEEDLPPPTAEADALPFDDGLDYAEPPREPLYPTGTLPGSTEKKRVMRKRIRAGESPFHPLDRKLHEEEDEWELRVEMAGLPLPPNRKGASNG